MNFIDIKVRDKLEREVKIQAKKQSEYKRRHTVKKLKEFGTDENRIKDDFAFYFKNTYGISGKELT